MNRIEEANKNIENLIRIFQEQENEIKQCKLQNLKLTKIFKLMLNKRFDIIELSSGFDSYDNENDVEKLYKSYLVLEKLYDILGDSAKKIARRPNQIGSVGGDIEKCWAFDIDFVDWEIQNHKNEKGSTLDNMDYWMPILRKELNVSESYFHESNYATIWIFKEGQDF